MDNLMSEKRLEVTLLGCRSYAGFGGAEVRPRLELEDGRVKSEVG